MAEVGLTRADTTSAGGAVTLLVDVVEAGRAVINVSAIHPGNEIVEDCGRLALQLPDEIQGWIWAASSGHALVIGTEGRPKVYNVSGTRENSQFRINYKSEFEAEFHAGDRIAMALAAGSIDGAFIPAGVRVVGSSARFSVVERKSEAYSCGSNFFDFEGDRLSVGAWPLAAGYSEQSVKVVRTENGTWGSFRIVMGPAAVCELEVRIDQKMFASTGQQTQHCLIDLPWAPPGDVSLIVRRELSAGGTASHWEIWDRALPMEAAQEGEGRLQPTNQSAVAYPGVVATSPFVAEARLNGHVRFDR